jgi:hypothetical protein
MRALISLAILSLMATAVSAQSPINRALIGCWSTESYDTVADDRNVSRELIAMRQWCFRDDGRYTVTDFAGGCMLNNDGHYELWGHTLVVDGSAMPFRIARLGTELIVPHGGEPETYTLKCRERDGRAACPQLFEPRRD